MSVVLTYSVPNDLAQLHDELLRAAALATPPGDVDNVPEYVEGLGDDITLTMPTAVDTAAIDAVVAAHVPQARYDPATQLATLARQREAARLRADYERLLVLFREVGVIAAVGNPGLAAVLDAATIGLIEVLKRRDRAAGLY